MYLLFLSFFTFIFPIFFFTIVNWLKHTHKFKYFKYILYIILCITINKVYIYIYIYIYNNKKKEKKKKKKIYYMARVYFFLFFLTVN